MEIKTLAEILAENSRDSKGAHQNNEPNRNLHHGKKNKSKLNAKKKQKQKGAFVAKSRAQTELKDKNNSSQDNLSLSSLSSNKNSYSNSNSNLKTNAIGSEIEPASSESVSNFDIANKFKTERFDHVSKNSSLKKSRKKRRKKSFHPASPYQPKMKHSEPVKKIDPNSIKSILAQVKDETSSHSEHIQSTHIQTNHTPNDNDVDNIQDDHLNVVDNLPTALKAYLKTPEQRQAEKEEIKANSRLRWLAFYYLSRREHSAGELRKKLIDKDQDPEKVEALLKEFAEKGYQSDYRTAIMLIREGIRKGRGRLRIKNDFIQRQVDAPVNIDELIDMAIEDNEEFVDVVSENELVDGVDWLRLAVEARVKKYGADIPTDHKQKVRQLRFLQYRGFKPDICFEAIKYNLDNLIDRY